MGILKNKYFIIGNILLLLAVIPLTLYIVKRQTSVRSKAAATTNLSYTPTSATIAIGQTTALDIMVDPAQNVVSIVELNIQVDPDKFEVVSLDKNADAFPSVLKGPTINSDGSVILSVTTSADVTKAIQTKTKVATLTLKGKAATSGASIVKFNKTGAQPTQVFSLAPVDGATENVLSDTGTANVTVSATAVSPTPGGGGGGGTASPTPGGSGGGQASPTPNGGGAKPLCSALNLDKVATGTAPYSITFSGVGTSSIGTITKAAFNFGDGSNQIVTSGGGLGTNSVNVQMAHTFVNAGTYSASVLFTNSNNIVSDPGNCVKAITITSAVVSPTATASAQLSPTTAPTASPTPIVATPTRVTQGPSPTLPITGTIQTTLTILGVIGATVGLGLFLFIL